MAEQEDLHDDEEHVPAPSLWPIGFAVGIVVILVGLVINPAVISSIGAVIVIVFGFLWAREATRELRGQHVEVAPEHGKPSEAGAPAVPATAGGPAAPPEPDERFPRSRFPEASTIGLGALIGGIITVPVTGFALLPSYLGQKKHRVDLGPVTDFKEGQWYIVTFMLDPEEGEVSRRTAFIRNNGSLAVNGKQVPSFTTISNRCAHLGCPVQANGPQGKIRHERTLNGDVKLHEVQPAGFGCPCHGGQYDTEGNRTAGPPVRALDRYNFAIAKGRLVLLSLFSVSHVDGTGAQAEIHAYKYAGPGIHVDGVEQILYPLNPPHN